MAANLLIVESPAKASTIEKYLGKDFKVLASYGHVRDLIAKKGAVNPDDNFSMTYENVERNAKHINAIVKEAKKAQAIYLATDLDREGEAISWHIKEILDAKKVLKDKDVYRVVFSEITKKAVNDAVANPRELSTDMVNAQQARRALDYLVGFNLSPLLWKKVKRGLSAGRVQSPALRMIVEREIEIEAFVPREYWTIEADLEKQEQTFVAKLWQLHGDKLKQFDLDNETSATEAFDELNKAANGSLTVDEVTSKQRRRNPAAPFITSTLQQEAARKLRFSTQKTMRVAQQLYEGIDIGQGPQGLITYMRTDSVTLSTDALGELRKVIGTDFGKDKVPESPNLYKTKSKNAQEAHEAIRPTSAKLTPQSIKSHLNDDQYKLYTLIWNRTVASQMIPAVLNTVAVSFLCGEGNIFRATGSTVVEPGFLSVYEEGNDGKEKQKENRLPVLKKGDKVGVNKIRPDQHFTEPPPRFSEASLVKTLEEFGIGRPSTYANIISTLVNREYVELESRRFTPTDIGRVVSIFLTDHFTRYVDYEFTARLEDELDAVSRGEKDWVPLLSDFWTPFIQQVEEKEQSVSRADVMQQRELGTDPKTSKPVSVRMGRYGPFVQIGTKEDEDKPQFASLRAGQKIDKITFEEAMELFKLPRKLGETDAGEPLSANIGRFGPYVRYGNKFASIPAEEDPHTITAERACELVVEKKKADAEKTIKTFDGSVIEVLKGRYGPYVTDGKKNGKIPKDVEPADLTLEQCEEIIAKTPAKKRRPKKKAKT